MAGKDFKAGIEIAVIDRSSSFIRRITSNFAALERTGKKAAKAFELSGNMRQAAGNVKSFASGAASALRGPVEKMMDFQEQMSSVKAATFDLTKAMSPEEFKAMEASVASLSTTARDLGASTKYSALEAAAGMDILAKNFSGGDMEKAKDVAAAMPGILQAAAATKESIADTADVFSASMNQFALKADDMGRIGDVYVKTANGSATGLLDLGEAMKYAGVTSAQAGLDLETTLGIMGALGNAGKKGSVAGTGLASVLGNLQGSSKKQRSALAALGINIKDKAGNLRPVLEIFAEIDKAADKKFGGKGKGGVRRDRWMQGLVGMGSDKETLAILTKAAGSGDLQALVKANKEAAGTAATVAIAMNANAAGSAKELASSYEELQLTIGETLIPKVTELLRLVKTITDDVAAWAKENKELVTVVGYVVGGLAALGGGVYAVITIVGAATAAWGAIVTVFGYASTAVSFLTGAFNVLKIAMLANPIVAIITAIAVAAGLIYYYWDPIAGFFVGMWDGIVSVFKTSMEWIDEQLANAAKGYEDLLLMFMTPAQAEIYVTAKQAKVADETAGSSLFEDDLDKTTGTSAMSQKGANRYAAKVDPTAELKSLWGDFMKPAANERGSDGIAQGAPLMPPDQAGAAARSRFDGQLNIKIDAEGRPTAEMKQTGDPAFEVRVNRGQAA